MTGHPFSLTAPGVVILAPGAAGTVTVTDAGTLALTVHEALGRYSVRSLRYPAASHATLTTMSGPWVTVTPDTFTLAPGHSEAVRISDHVPAGVQGDHYLSVVWTATAPGAGNLHLAGAVATSVEIPMPGTATAVTASGLAQAPAAPPAPSGTGAGLLAVLAFAVLAVLVVVIAVRRRVRRA